jgi:hypothetical protein
MTKTPAVGPGLRGEKSESGKPSPDSAGLDHRQQPVDPRAAWLLRASARYHLVREAAMTLDEAFSPDFIDDFLTADAPIRSRRGE